uniref:RING-type domain-containing protein n=1 Tax=Acrobeloides nanus TaxID=290746 RepID=A0A914D3T3_9BILA
MWFLDNNLYVEAMECALAHRDALQNVSVSEVGRQLVENLIKDGKFDTAARYVKQICGWDKEEWEHYVGQFEEHHHVLKLVPVIPTKSPQLEPECYEVILTSALICKPMLFKKLVHMWNPDLYRVGAIIDKIIKRMHDNLNHDPNQSSLSKEEITYLYQSLAHLYVYTRNFERALELYLLLKDPAVFNAIKKHRLFGHVKDRIVELMDINADLAVRLLLDDDEETVPASTVVTQLSRMPKLQMLYLNRLLSKGEGSDYSDLLIKLYAEYDKDKLMSFLRKAENYKIDQALEICKRHNYIEEVIFLLGKSGDRFEALDVIMNMGRIEKAIDFCTEHEDDVELWNRLIELAMRRPDHITRLLSSAGSYINPLEVIQKVPSEMDIPGLRKSVMKVLRDYELQVGLLGVSQQAIQEDVLTLFEKTLYHPGILIDTEIRCDICKETLRPDPKSRKASQELRLFACGHNLHKSCVENQLSHEDFKKATMSDKKLALNPFDEDFEICPACYVQNEQQIELGNGDDSNATSPITPVPMSMI